MDALSKHDDLKVFDSHLLKYYIDYIWKKARRKIFWLSFVPYMIYFLMFVVIFGGFSFIRKYHEPDTFPEWKPYHIALTFMASLGIVFVFV